MRCIKAVVYGEFCWDWDTGELVYAIPGGIYTMNGVYFLLEKAPQIYVRHIRISDLPSAALDYLKSRKHFRDLDFEEFKNSYLK